MLHGQQDINTPKSRIVTALGTNHVSPVIIRDTFDWNLCTISILQNDADPHNCHTTGPDRFQDCFVYEQLFCQCVMPWKYL